MPHYFSDTFDGTVVLDDEGRTLPDLVSARLEARHLLEALVPHAAPERDASAFRVDIRDAAGHRMLTATPTLTDEVA